jgi:hypothetical protein
MPLSRGEQRARKRKKELRPRKRITQAEVSLAHGLLWFVLLTKPGKELAAEMAVDDGLPDLYAFTPRETRVIRKSRWRYDADKHRKIEVSAYPRYLFVGVPPKKGSAGAISGASLPVFELSQISLLSGYLGNERGEPVRVAPCDVAELMRKSAKVLFRGRDRAREDAVSCPVFYPGEELIGIGAFEALRGKPSRVLGGVAEFDSAMGVVKVPFEKLKLAQKAA